ncbi:MAG: PspC domain-containing protein [Chloroflexota bacterium]|nr:MAG: PspC domain-containing protein [Chloroflexota bacterium]
MSDTRLTRSTSDRMIAGVCAGLARYFNIDPVIVRLLFVVAVFAGGVSPLIYVLLWIVMPQEGAATTAPALPNHPRSAEEWKYDPYTGERIER